MESMMDEIQ